MDNSYYVAPCSIKNKTTALLLCIFGGFFGLHQFYAGRVGRGILYLLTGGGLLVFWAVDIIRIATNTFTDSAGFYITNHNPHERSAARRPDLQSYSVPGPIKNRTADEKSTIEFIKQYKELLDAGAITQEEYDRKKAELLSNPSPGGLDDDDEYTQDEDFDFLDEDMQYEDYDRRYYGTAPDYPEVNRTTPGFFPRVALWMALAAVTFLVLISIVFAIMRGSNPIKSCGAEREENDIKVTQPTESDDYNVDSEFEPLD